MANRPYFKHGIEQIQELVATSRSDLKVLKVIQYELVHRNRPKARALKVEVDELDQRIFDRIFDTYESISVDPVEGKG